MNDKNNKLASLLSENGFFGSPIRNGLLSEVSRNEMAKLAGLLALDKQHYATPSTGYETLFDPGLGGSRPLPVINPPRPTAQYMEPGLGSPAFDPTTDFFGTGFGKVLGKVTGEALASLKGSSLLGGLAAGVVPFKPFDMKSSLKSIYNEFTYLTNDAKLVLDFKKFKQSRGGWSDMALGDLTPESKALMLDMSNYIKSSSLNNTPKGQEILTELGKTLKRGEGLPKVIERK